MIPQQLNYNYIKPKGFVSQSAQWVINPMGQQNTFGSNQIIRFQMNIQTGHFDPYRSFFQIIVQTDLPCGAVQIDGSAYGFISQSLITSITNATQLQRIPQYDQIGAIITNMGYDQTQSIGRQYQGFGRNFYTNCSKAPMSATSSANNTLCTLSNPNQYTATFADYGANNFNPLFINRQQSTIGAQNVGFMNKDSNSTIKQPGIFSKYKQLSQQDLNSASSQLSITTVVGNSPSILSQLNAGMFLQSIYNQIYNANKGLVVPRVQYSLATLGTQYIDAPWSNVRNSLVAKSQINNFSMINPKQAYMVGSSPTINIKYYDMTNTQSPSGTVFNVQNSCGLHGYSNAFSPQMSVGCQQPFISPTIPQCGMKNGKILKQMLPINQRRFIVPFLSSTMGALIPQTSYVLLPAQAFKVYIQLTLNQFAMFSSGYNDRTPYDSVGMQVPIPRRFYFRRFNYVLQLYYFNQPDIKQWVQRSLIQGFQFSTQPIMLVSTYTIPNQLALRGSWQINSPNNYISQILIRFIDNRYLRYPFLRKQYALSCGITSFQLKFDTRWYPPQPIIGNAGNPQYLDSSGCVQPYIQMLYKGKDNLFSRSNIGIINPFNFSVNDRCYDVTDTRTYFPIGTQTNSQYNTCSVRSQSQLNVNTALGQSFFHQNRCVGRGLYLFNFQSQGHSKGFANGLDLGNSRPFQVIFNTDVNQPYQHQIGMYIFSRYHAVVIVGKKGVYVQDIR